MAGPYPKGRVFTGARARLMADTVPLGWATECDGNEETQFEAIEVMDNLEVVEHVPVGYRVGFRAGYVRIIGGTDGNGIRNLGIFPKLGKTADDHLRHILDIGTNGEFEVQLDDSISGKTFMLLTGCKAASRDWRVQARSVTSENVVFVGLRMLDETEA